MNAKDMNATKWFETYPFEKEWILTGAKREMINFSDKAGKYMADNGLKSSKIRNFYGEFIRIRMGKFGENKSSFFLLRPKLAYALGRDKENQGLMLFKLIFDEAEKFVTDQSSFNNLCGLFEAILGYHRSYVKKND